MNILRECMESAEKLWKNFQVYKVKAVKTNVNIVF